MFICGLYQMEGGEEIKSYEMIPDDPSMATDSDTLKGAHKANAEAAGKIKALKQQAKALCDQPVCA